MRRSLITTASVVAVFLVVGAAAYALISNTSSTTEAVGKPAVQVAATGGTVQIDSSKGGSAILIADGMVPGETRGDTVKIRNTGTLPITLSMGASGITATPANASSIFHTKLFETGNGAAPLYSGPVKDFKPAQVGDISPGEAKDFTLQAILPSNVGNEAENIKTTFNIDWSAVEKTTGPPPPECKLKKIRARFFVFRGKPVIRMVNRYQANASGKVKATFYWRNKKGKGKKAKFVRGKKIGTMLSSFKKTKPGQWKRYRTPKRQSLKAMKQFRASKHGFYAALKPLKTPNYCTNYLNVDLTQLKRKYGNGQFTWFQKGSFNFVR